MAKDYYQILGVSRDASTEEIKKSYRRLAMQYHPDRNPGKGEVYERMKGINEAYAVLSNPQKRRDYDRHSSQYGDYAYDRFRQTYSEQDIFKGSDINLIFEEFAKWFGYRDFDQVFRDLYGQIYRTFEFRRPGIFLKGIFFQGALGGSRYKEIHRENYEGHAERDFSTHEGVGLSASFLNILGRRWGGFIVERFFGGEIPQRGRDSYGEIGVAPEEAAKGTKVVYHPRRRLAKKLLVKIPPGTKDAQRIRLKGMGHKGRYGGEAGDLYLKIKIKVPIPRRIGDLMKRIF